MHRTQLYVPQSLWKSVQTEAQTKQVTASEVVRDILTKYFVRGLKLVKPAEGLLEFSQRMNKKYPTGGPKDLASTIDQYLYGNKP